MQSDLLRDGTRVRILDAATEGATAAELAAAVGIPVTRVYHHIDKLVAVGLLEVVRTEKRDAAVAAVYRATRGVLTRRGDRKDIEYTLSDALRDLVDSPADSIRVAGRTVTRMTRGQARDLTEQIAALADEIRERDEPDEGDLVGLTYVVAPIVRPRGPVVTMRVAEASDIEFVQRIVYEALLWNPDASIPPIEQIVDHPEFARYHRDWGRPGDAGVLAMVDNQVVGGAFYRLFTEDDHGHGYVDPDTPEIAIAIWGVPRGRGVGSALLDALHEMAGESGFMQLSLSVDKPNPAGRLYRRHGYIVHSAGDGSFVMTRKR